MSEIDKSIKGIGTDYVDLYQIHRCDYDAPIEETMEVCIIRVSYRYGSGDITLVFQIVFSETKVYFLNDWTKATVF